MVGSGFWSWEHMLSLSFPWRGHTGDDERGWCDVGYRFHSKGRDMQSGGLHSIAVLLTVCRFLSRDKDSHRISVILRIMWKESKASNLVSSTVHPLRQGRYRGVKHFHEMELLLSIGIIQETIESMSRYEIDLVAHSEFLLPNPRPTTLKACMLPKILPCQKSKYLITWKINDLKCLQHVL